MHRVFKHSVEKIDLRGESSINAEWMAYIGGFVNLYSLNLSDCLRINNSTLWPITGMLNEILLILQWKFVSNVRFSILIFRVIKFEGVGSF